MGKMGDGWNNPDVAIQPGTRTNKATDKVSEAFPDNQDANATMPGGKQVCPQPNPGKVPDDAGAASHGP